MIHKSLFLGFLQNLQGWELLIIFFVILLLFGAKKLPELAKGIGKAIKEFKTAANSAEEGIREAMDVSSTATPTDKSPETPKEK